MKKRNNSIDAIKGIAIVLVMIGHVFVHNHMEDPYVYDFIKAVQMPLFMIISGYLCGQRKKISKIKEYVKVLGKRAMAYLIPFFVWLSIMHMEDIFGAYKKVFLQLDYGLWFLAVLFILTFMIYTAQLIASLFVKKKQALREIVFWSVYAFFCVVLVLQIFTGNLFLSPYLTIIYVPFYMLGYIVGNYGKLFLCWENNEAGKIDCKNSRWIQGGSIVCAVAFLYLIITRNINCMETRTDVILQMFASLLGSVAVIYGVLWMKNGTIKNIFAKIGKYTLEVYVIHYHFANMLNFKDQQYYLYTVSGTVFVVLSIVAMSAVTFSFIWIMKKIKVLDFLFFGKVS